MIKLDIQYKKQINILDIIFNNIDIIIVRETNY